MTTKELKQGCVFAPTLFNLFLSDLSAELDNCNHHAPNLGGLTLSNLLYADDLILNPVGLQHLINATSSFSDKNGLTINLEKSKVMILNQKGKKFQSRWELQGQQLEVIKEYKYLGIIFDRKGSFGQQKTMIKTRGTALAVSQKNIKLKIMGPDLTPLLEVLRAKLLPTITYGSECMSGRDETILDKVVSKSLQILFNLPQYTSPAQLRLEFGLQKQQVARKGAYTKCWHKIKGSEVGSLNSYLWKELERNNDSPAMVYLQTALNSLALQDLWEINRPHKIFKQLVNRTVRTLSLEEDKSTLTKRAQGWFIIQSYTKSLPQAYLGTGFSRIVNESYLKLRKGVLPANQHLPPWKRLETATNCRISGNPKEDILHLLCSYMALDKERRLLLKPLWNLR